MSDLLDQMRVQMLRQNLRLVIQLKETVLQRRQAMLELLDRPTGWVRELRDARTGPLRDLEDTLAALPPEVDTSVAETARRALQDAVARLEDEVGRGLRDGRELAEAVLPAPRGR